MNRKKKRDIRPGSRPSTVRGDGKPLHPGDGVVPILKEVGHKRLMVIGTGFYVTRYGLFITARHVLKELKDSDKGVLSKSFVCHMHKQGEIFLRPILRAHWLNEVDIGAGQADNYMGRHPANPLMNLRGRLCAEFPREGEPLTTYAYPENEVLDFSSEEEIPEIFGDFFQGGFLRFVKIPEHPFLPFSYFETAVELRGGMSGGPVFDSRGRIVGVNCRGWDFRGTEHEASPLSYIVPIAYILDLGIDTFMVPPQSWEAHQLPSERVGTVFTGRELARYGHLRFEPPLEAA